MSKFGVHTSSKISRSMQTWMFVLELYETLWVMYSSMNNVYTHFLCSDYGPKICLHANLYNFLTKFTYYYIFCNPIGRCNVSIIYSNPLNFPSNSWIRDRMRHRSTHIFFCWFFQTLFEVLVVQFRINFEKHAEIYLIVRK